MSGIDWDKLDAEWTPEIAIEVSRDLAFVGLDPHLFEEDDRLNEFHTVAFLGLLSDKIFNGTADEAEFAWGILHEFRKMFPELAGKELVM